MDYLVLSYAQDTTYYLNIFGCNVISEPIFAGTLPLVITNGEDHIKHFGAVSALRC